MILIISLLPLLLTLMASPSASLPPQPNCPVRCGEVEVPFPFGLGEGCYLDQSFALTCNHSSTAGSPGLFFQGVDNVRVTNISIARGVVDLRKKKNMCGDSDEYYQFMNFGSFEDLGMIFNWAVGIKITCKEAMANHTISFACKSENSYCVDTYVDPYGGSMNFTTGQAGYLCNCSQGFQGNPYIPDGCQAIDVCKLPRSKGQPIPEQCIPKSQNKLGIIVGIAAGLSTIILIISFAFLVQIWKKRHQKRIRAQFFRKNHGLLLQQQLNSSNSYLEQKATIFSLDELEKATNKFDDTLVVGQGGHGTVYKGILSDKRVAAIKKSKITDKSEIDQFINEVAILSQINHRNVVKLFGCCLETEVPLLVYEFISNGTLSSHLHGAAHHNSTTLPWNDRLRIAIEAAGAVTYLHRSASISIFHRDMKTSNILLDDYFTAKISDFGASRTVSIDMTHVDTVVQGTFGYLDPEYFQTSQLTEKSDVYSFGVILVELLTGNPVINEDVRQEMNLIMKFLQAKKSNNVFEMLEACVVEEATEDELDEVIQLAEDCLNLKGDDRPTMKEVEYRLQSLRRNKNKVDGEPSEENNGLLCGFNFPSFSTNIQVQASEETSRNFSFEIELESSLLNNPR